MLYSGDADIYSHRIRMILMEKAVACDIVTIDREAPPQNLLEINPYTITPTLVDRDLVLYNARIIAEYLDERFPHPPLLPVYPISRAKFRLLMYRIEEDWFSLVQKIEFGTEAVAKKAREQLETALLEVAPLFSEMPYFLSEEFSLVDCYVAPLIWRLPYYEIDLGKGGKAISEYGKRIFSKPSFKASLSDLEKEIGSSWDI